MVPVARLPWVSIARPISAPPAAPTIRPVVPLLRLAAQAALAVVPGLAVVIALRLGRSGHGQRSGGNGKAGGGHRHHHVPHLVSPVSRCGFAEALWADQPERPSNG
jgi:hypothetical protein